MSTRQEAGFNLLAIGLASVSITALLGLFYAPSVSAESWEAPEAYRILFLHVPFAWSSFLAFTLLFIGAVKWYAKRDENGWIWFQTGSDLGLVFGLGVITSGPIWGSAEWGTPWDWGDLRLNTFALLTAVALFLVLSRRSQADSQETRDTLSAVGLFGFALVPNTALATTWYQERHPGVLIINSEDSGLDPEIKMILLFGFLSMCVVFAGLVRLSNLRYRLAAELVGIKRGLDENSVAAPVEHDSEVGS